MVVKEGVGFVVGAALRQLVKAQQRPRFASGHLRDGGPEGGFW